MHIVTLDTVFVVHDVDTEAEAIAQARQQLCRIAQQDPSCFEFVVKEKDLTNTVNSHPFPTSVAMLKTLISKTIARLSDVYDLLLLLNADGRQCDFATEPNIGVERLASLVDKIKKVYYQEIDS